MKIRTATAAAALMLATGAFAALPEYVFVDKSAETLIDAATARALFVEAETMRLAKLYPPSTWGFATQVSGGITSDTTCVVTARVMLLPRNNPRPSKTLLFKPEQMATAFGAKAQATEAQCRDLAKAKLREAIDALTSALAPR